MSENDGPKGYVIDRGRLPVAFPTHRHDAVFWEWLGRAVASFGFLEETLAKAIFSFATTAEFSEDKLTEVLDDWNATVRRAASDALGSLIELYGSKVRRHHASALENLDDLLNDLRKASSVRNALCHGSWQVPDESGKAIPFFINKKLEVFETPIDVEFLKRTQRHVTELICAVIDTVTHMGWQFPGSTGSGERIWPAA